jgi:CHAT domain-containing protein
METTATSEGIGLPQDDISGFHPGLLSGIALAGANQKNALDGESDGILSAEEVATLSLDGVQLVTLSACETGLGKVAGGEGLLGLQRAFQVAGADTVLATLWKIPDQTTRRLMERYYQNLWLRGMGKFDALREAQLWILREGAAHETAESEVAQRAKDQIKPARNSATQRVSPYYWAGFVLSGDWR